MKHFHSFACFIISLLFSISCQAQEFSKYEKEIYTEGKDTLAYRILMPENFDPAKKYPVLFFLHGSGERGSDNSSQLTHGGNLFLKSEVRKNFPAIIIFPQCAQSSYWSNVIIAPTGSNERFDFQKGGKPTKSMHALLGLVNQTLKKPYVNLNQVYVGGLSMGGMGTYEILRRKPKTFAAAFSICGGDNVANVEKYKNVPLWIFHGSKDDVVNPAFSKSIANQLKIIGKEVKFTVYPEANHNSWDSAFAEPELLAWLFSHQKTR
ncbi:prolyl oligopeptidase family serine peptidase [Pedobacter antarcticus]|uniref:carboxylesterase family protein n=1 Tax=Pedobacter antarcticus TaxID=34086 RepID=UPI00088B617F|nr:prolyl oligopeptidase family serine peptidase [Pedobacter antarcticus]SDM56013.1 Alpha/beta hydrolase family protein [Pedobacter antarcticus]